MAHEVEAAAHGRRIVRCWPGDIVETAADADGLTKPPLLVLDRVRAFLDERGLGEGDVRAGRIGEGGGSNFTFLLERDVGSFVLRRRPRPPLPPSAHDVVREAKLQLALREAGFERLPTIVAVCEDESLLGVPFYVMAYLDGLVPTDEPRRARAESARRALGEDLVDALVGIHSADVTTPGLAAFARPGSYNERQVRRFTQLWEINKTREIPKVDEVGAWLAENVPAPLAPTVVHGDFRLGNTMVGRDDPPRILAVLDWEMGAIGDPRADVGYLLATYSEPGGPPNPLGTSPITALAGFPSRGELVERYVAESRRDVEPLAWFEGLALWKAAVFCEAIYGATYGVSSVPRTSARPASRKACRILPRPPRPPFRATDATALVAVVVPNTSARVRSRRASTSASRPWSDSGPRFDRRSSSRSCASRALSWNGMPRESL